MPDIASIVARRLGRVAYAIYASRDLKIAGTARDALRGMPWAGFDDEHDYMPGQSWMLALLEGARPAVRVNNWLILYESVRAGAGLAVLPCYLGDADRKLRRLGAILSEVAVDQWLLVHRDLRALPRVRAVMDALVRLFQEERAQLEGKRAEASAETGR